MELLNFSQIVQEDEKNSKLIPYISENVIFQKFKKEEYLVENKLDFNLSWEKKEIEDEKSTEKITEVKGVKNEGRKKKIKEFKGVKKDVKKKSELPQDSRTDLILKGQKVKYKNHILVIDGKRYLEGKKLIKFLISNSSHKPQIRQIEEFIKFINKLPKKNKKHLGKCAKRLLME